MRFIPVCAFALTLASLVQAADVEWKMYRTASPSDDEVCFYDPASLTRTSAGLGRVWTKCLLQSVLDGIDKKSELGRRIVKNTARKVVDDYVPPIAAIEHLDFEETIEIIRYEETANIGGIEPQARFFYEVKCPERIMRRLSADDKINGKGVTDNTPSEWESPPEGSGATLPNILCPPLDKHRSKGSR